MQWLLSFQLTRFSTVEIFLLSSARWRYCLILTKTSSSSPLSSSQLPTLSLCWQLPMKTLLAFQRKETCQQSPNALASDCAFLKARADWPVGDLSTVGISKQMEWIDGVCFLCPVHFGRPLADRSDGQSLLGGTADCRNADMNADDVKGCIDLPPATSSYTLHGRPVKNKRCPKMGKTISWVWKMRALASLSVKSTPANNLDTAVICCLIWWRNSFDFSFTSDWLTDGDNLKKLLKFCLNKKYEEHNFSWMLSSYVRRYGCKNYFMDNWANQLWSQNKLKMSSIKSVRKFPQFWRCENVKALDLLSFFFGLGLALNVASVQADSSCTVKILSFIPCYL